MMALVIALLLQTPHPATVHIAVQGETNLTTNFIQELEADAEPFGLIIRVVDRHNADLNYNVVLAEESTLGSAAAAIVALDRDGHVVASVVRSDRFSGRAAVSVATKEFAKKLAALKKIGETHSGKPHTKREGSLQDTFHPSVSPALNVPEFMGF